MKKLMAKTFFPLMGVVVLGALLFFGIRGITQKNPDAMAAKLHNDLQQLAMLMQRIDKDCSIVEVDCESNNIDFLTLEKAEGSEVGALTLAYPEKYKGPYLKKDLMYQEVLYQIVHAHDGFFMVPGIGTRLPNGLEMGTDVVITQKTHMQELIQPGAALNYKGILFAIPFLMQGDAVETKKPFQTPAELLKEFNAVMPFVQNFKEGKVPQSAYIENEC